MQNPFKTGDMVLTKLKGKEVQAAVTQTWKNEVQVKTTEGELLWRTAYTVWYLGESPMQRAAKDTNNTSKPSPPIQTRKAGRAKTKQVSGKRSRKRK